MQAFHALLRAACGLPACFVGSILLHLMLALLVNQLVSSALNDGTLRLARTVSNGGRVTASLVSISVSGAKKAEVGVPASSTETVANSAADEPGGISAADEENDRGVPPPFSLPLSIPFAEPRYFRTSELTRKPLLSEEFSLIFPALTDVGVAGKIILRLLISESGAVDKVIVEESELPEMLQESVVNRFSNATFLPGMIEDVPVKSTMKIEVLY